MLDLSPSFSSFAAIFFMGLALNLTPCIYPMFSITVALFGIKDNEKRADVFVNALLYVFGIISMYSVLGFFAAISGALFGTLLQSRWVLLAMGIVIAFLAFSMLGVYNLRIPNVFSIDNKKIQNRFLKFYVSGIFVGIVAAPCIGPVIIAFFTLAGTQGNPLFALWLFFVLSLGLSFPYLILGTFSGLIRRLPKSGVWLIWVERSFGIVLLGFSLFYIFLALNINLLNWIVPITLIGGGIYLGWLEKSGDNSGKFSIFKKMAGIFLIVASILMVLNMPKDIVKWDNYYTGVFEESKKEQTPVIVEFYADWCMACQELERYVYTDSNVINGLERFKRVKVDLTNEPSAVESDLISKFNVRGVPTIVFLDENGNERKEIRIEGYIPPDSFLELLKKI